jgi:hypothetical protein
MDPNDIELSDLNKIFEYERLSRDIDSCEDIDDIKMIAKSYIKLYLATIESIIKLQ